MLKINTSFSLRKRNIMLFAALFTVMTVAAGAFAYSPDIAIYSKSYSYVAEYCDVNSGSVMSERDVLIDYCSDIRGDIKAGDDVQLCQYVDVEGDVEYYDKFYKSCGVDIEGTVSGDVEFEGVEMEELSVSIGCYNVCVPDYGCKVLNPGKYYNLDVGYNARLYLKPGIYNFRTFETEQYARIYIDLGPGDEIDINVRDFMILHGGTKIKITGENDPSRVHIYSGQSGWLQVGPYAQVSGILTAPNASIYLHHCASWTGSLFGYSVSLDYYSSLNSVLYQDSDCDDVPDVVEYEAETDPHDADSKPAVLVSGSWVNKTDKHAQELVYDFSHFPGYEHLKNVPVYLPYESVDGDLTVIYTIEDAESVKRNGYVNNQGILKRYGGNVNTDVLTRDFIPVEITFSGLPQEAVELYEVDENDNKVGSAIPLTKVTYTQAFTDVVLDLVNKKYKLFKRIDTYRVSKDFTDDQVASNKYDVKFINDAFEKIADAALEPQNNGVCPESFVLVATTDQNNQVYKPDDGEGRFQTVFEH